MTETTGKLAPVARTPSRCVFVRKDLPCAARCFRLNPDTEWLLSTFLPVLCTNHKKMARGRQAVYAVSDVRELVINRDHILRVTMVL
jgi:hypothetical protein